MSYVIKIQGLDELQRAFSKSPRIVAKELNEAVKTSVNMIRPIMRSESPVDV